MRKLFTKLQVQFAAESPTALLQELLENRASALNVLERATLCADALAKLSNLPAEKIRNAIVVEGFVPEAQAFSLRLKVKGVWTTVRVTKKVGESTWLIDGPAPDFDQKRQEQFSSGVVEVTLHYLEATDEELPKKFVEAFQNMQAFIGQEVIA